MANAFLLKPEVLTALRTSEGGSAAVRAAAQMVGNDYAGLVWRAPVGDSTYITVDLGSDVAVDTIALHGLAGMASTATWQVLASTSAAGPPESGSTFWQSAPAPLLAGSVRQVSGAGAGLWMAPTSGGPPSAVRYVQANLYGIGAGNQAQIGRMGVGKRTVLERNFEIGGAFGVREFGTLDFSARGVMLRRRAKRLRTVGISFPNIFRDEIDTVILPLLEQLGNTETVTLVTDPAVHAMRERRMYHGPLVGDLGVTQRHGAIFRAACNLVSLF